MSRSNIQIIKQPIRFIVFHSLFQLTSGSNRLLDVFCVVVPYTNQRRAGLQLSKHRKPTISIPSAPHCLASFYIIYWQTVMKVQSRRNDICNGLPSIEQMYSISPTSSSLSLPSIPPAAVDVDDDDIWLGRLTTMASVVGAADATLYAAADSSRKRKTRHTCMMWCMLMRRPPTSEVYWLAK